MKSKNLRLKSLKDLENCRNTSRTPQNNNINQNKIKYTIHLILFKKIKLKFKLMQ